LRRNIQQQTIIRKDRKNRFHVPQDERGHNVNELAIKIFKKRTDVTLTTNKKDVCNTWKDKKAIPHITKLSLLADEVRQMADFHLFRVTKFFLW